jgi:hypothetical protein
MGTLDLHKEHPNYFRALPQPELIHLDKGKFISIEGQGRAGSPAMSSRLKALYPVASRIRRYYKEHDQDFVIPQLESEWWSASRKPINKIPNNQRNWKLMIRLPDFVEQHVVELAKKQAIMKDRVIAALWIKLEIENPHDAVQMLHIGPWSREKDTIKQIRQYIKKQHLALDGHHHEVYLSDPHHTDPARLRTIVRQTVVN